MPSHHGTALAGHNAGSVVTHLLERLTLMPSYRDTALRGQRARLTLKPSYRDTALRGQTARLTLMPSHRDTALRGRRARSVLRDLMELTLPIPAPSIATMKIDNCRSINRTCAKKLYTQMQAGAIFIGCNYIEYRIRYTGGGKKGGEEAYILGWFWVVVFFLV